MNYKGVIIEESLVDISIIKELVVISQEVEMITEAEETPWLDRWTMDTVLIPEEKINDYAERLSKLIDIKHCSNWYCDFRNEKYHYVVFSNKVFCLDRKKKEDYKVMQDYAISIGLPKHQLPNFNGMDDSLLTRFLVSAKKMTYANATIEKVNASRLGSNDYHYEAEIEGEIMKYHDTYFGTTKFIGEEVVYRESEVPKWGMNYYGVTLDENATEEMMDKVLRTALSKVGEDNTVLPLRGPSHFENGEYTYTFTSNGTIENFTGIEQVFKGGELIFELHCHGGSIE